ncbi:MAG: protein kinase [Deltaproteobacteria bacterium]|nr:protein kinase [Deltaproteobacteria bacterium]
MGDERTVLLCPACGAELPAGAERCGGCGSEPLLRERYSMERFLGSGGQGRTYAGRDRQNGEQVAVKELSVARSRDWKMIELFRRSAEVVAKLEHPGIPQLVDYFEVERSGVTFYYLVQEFIDGESFAAQLAQGRRFDEAEAREIAREALGILRYLHGRTPPVVHRDVKPSNLMRRRDGRLVLIDFDLVRQHARPAGGSTLAIGTPGFAPLEQYVGEATPATDLYALGATLVALLSRKEPATLLDGRTARLAFRPHVNVGDSLAAILERLLEPDVRRRYATAEAVLADLEAEVVAPPRPAPEAAAPRSRKPPGRLARWIEKLSEPGSLATALVVLVVVGFLAYVAIRALSEERSATRAEEAKRASDVTDSGNWTSLDDAFRWGLDGSPHDIRKLVTSDAPDLGRLDPVGALPWAAAIARRWSADAVLSSVRVDDGGPGGTVDAAAESAGRVAYEFVSPERIRSYYDNLAVRVAPIDHELRLTLYSGRVELSFVVGQPPQEPPPAVGEPTCPFPDVVASWRAASAAAAGAGVDASLTREDVAAWRIGDGGGGSTVRVDAGTCAVLAAECAACASAGSTCEGGSGEASSATDRAVAIPPPGEGWAPVACEDEGWTAFAHAGTVVEARGAAPVPLGAPVEVHVALDPVPGELNCRIVLACAGKTLYGAETSGYNRCAIEGGRPATALDVVPAESDSDPMMRLDLPGGTLAVGGGTGSRYLLEFALEPEDAGTGTTVRRATVTSAEGAAPVAVGASCELVVRGPFEQHPCRFVVGLVDRAPLYGNEGSGYNPCTIVGGAIQPVRDDVPSGEDGDPVFEFDLSRGEVRIADPGEGDAGEGYEVLVRLDGAGGGSP